MANVADVKLKVTLNNRQEEPIANNDISEESILYEIKDDFIRLEEVCDELHEISYRDFNVDFSEEGIAEISMGCRNVANIEAFQNICTNYDCSIIGVAWEFENDYVETFELFNEVKVEDTSNHYVTVQASTIDEEYVPKKEWDEINLD